MAATHRSLEALRREIDDLDDGIHDLLTRRTDIVGEIAALKADTNGMVYRPAREAQILRRLLGRNDGKLSHSLIVRLWRELLSATTQLQGPFRVAVARREESPELWLLAREHFGASATLAPQGSPAQIINAVSEGEVEVGVVPWPQFDEPHPWWGMLSQGKSNVPQIVGRLPFLAAPSEATNDRIEAFAIGVFDRGESGADRSIIALECHAEVSRGGVYGALEKAGLEPGLHAIWAVTGAEVRWHLADVKGYVREADDPLSEVSMALGAGLLSTRPLGGYATQIASSG